MRRRRLARLGGLNTNNVPASSTNTTVLTSPSTPGPSKMFAGQISLSIQQQFQHAEIPMEVDENGDKQCNTSGIDVDSGIETMEVEESDRKDSTPRSRVSWILKLFRDRNHNFIYSLHLPSIIPSLCISFRQQVPA